ncbi:conserved hypothetical protein [Neospora caninum Liverpool]|uniref:High-temperature-induced dauer-formation protein n=1 Tax=Neospora caninum (strain Liverpool) TaxID=572307 RepID=F0VKG2_NEOCL|nr:conserved hypothetical protein [Neospora caninum Liverpool]CBZ54563.1 conserved hypothetical protein [Neospora caninum Liverpool]CEL69277.1 TPA: hypothetical protein BN1204_049920 [Neospora caninum Liverpool]|eukprot:XP_003884593.1 conserved hypothetical protein [Neospora caninum Liverpool]
MGNADSKTRGDFQLFNLLQIANKGDADDNTEDGTQATQHPRRLRAFLEANLTAQELEAGLGSREEILHTARQYPDAVAKLLTQLVDVCTATADAVSQQPATLRDSSTLLTTVRLLSRMVPVLLEDPSLEQRIFWFAHFTPLSPGGNSDTRSRCPSPAGDTQLTGEAIEAPKDAARAPSDLAAHAEREEDSEGEDRAAEKREHGERDAEGDRKDERKETVSPASTASQTSSTGLPVLLGNEIVNLLFRLLFLRGFTAIVPGAPLSQEALRALPKHKVDLRFLWKGGVGAAPDFAIRPSGWISNNRTEVMNCLTACFSGPLYNAVDEYQLRVPTWIRVATAGNAPYTANLFCSLLSVVCSTDTTHRGVFGIFGNAETQAMVAASLQLLIVLLDFNVGVFVLPEGTEETETTKGDKVGRKTPPSLRNVFRSMLAGIHRTDEFDFIYDGLTHHLGNAAYRPHSAAISEKPDLFCEQLLILTWHLFTLNGNFLRHVCSRRGADALLRPLVALLLDASFFIHRRAASGPAADRDTLSPSTNGDTNRVKETGLTTESAMPANPAEAATALSRMGLLHMCSFILLVLSSERDFAVRLNEAFVGKAPADLPVFQGTYADFLCLAIHRVVMDATGPRGSSDSLVDMLLTVLCNVSAYVKAFCLESCLRLMAMMERLTRRYWLFSAPQHYHDVFFLLDVFNNLIQYQFEGNSQLVYAILRQKKIFCDLETLTLPASMRSSRRAGTKDGEEAVAETPESGDRSRVSKIDSCGGSERDEADCSERNGEKPEGEDAGGRDEGAGEAREDESLAGEDDRWEPTEEWLEEWKQKLPLQTILRLIQCLLPQVEEECARREVTDQQDILAFLEKTTMVGLLPVPHPIIIRNYQPNAYTALWFTSFMWGVLLVSSPALSNVTRSRIRLIVMNP